MFNLSTTSGRLRLAVAWCGSLYGLSQVHKLDLGHFTAICGRWGCLAATGSVVGIHLVSLFLVGSVSFAAVYSGRISRANWGKLLVLVGLTLSLSVCGFAIFKWRPVGSEWMRLFPFSLISSTDIPAIQTLLVGVYYFATRNRRTTTDVEPVKQVDEPHQQVEAM